MTESHASFGRRNLFQIAGAGAVAGFVVPGPAQAQSPANPPQMVSPTGSYETKPLRRDQVRVSAVQSALLAAQAASAKVDIRRNLERVLDQFDATQTYFMGGQDLVVFQEFVIQGWDRWDRPDLEKIALDLPGRETEAIGAKCKQYNCYAAFGGYFRIKDWPGHIITAYVLMNPKGEIEDVQWKPFDKYGDSPTADYFTTTVYSVLDAYVERYGWDRVIPVARTDIGNITMSAVMREPELFRCMAMKGAEIFVRSGLGGYSAYDGAACSRYNGAFTMFVTNALSPGNKGYFADNGMLGDTAIYDLRGERLGNRDSGKHETAVVATLDVAGIRKPARIPDVYTALYMPHYQQYVSQFPPGRYAAYQPKSLSDASRYNAEGRRWPR